MECWLETGERALCTIGDIGERGDLRSRDLYLAGGSSAELPLSTRLIKALWSPELRLGRNTGGDSQSVPSSSLGPV